VTQLKRWAPVAGWMAVIFFLSAQPELPTPEQGWLDVILEKSGHGFEFAVLAVLLVRALDPGRIGRWRPFTIAMLGAWAYALLDEYHQLYVPGRTASWSDISFDWLGAVIGVWLWRYKRSAGEKNTLSDKA
jgi:VanZ family protein